VMNPAADKAEIRKAYEDDPESASAEYGAEFRQGISNYLTQEVLDSCTAFDVHELPPARGVRYQAFCDPSGGSADSYTLAIALPKARTPCSTPCAMCARPIARPR